MTNPRYGQLTNPDRWRQRIPDPLFNALADWTYGQAFDLTHQRWLTDGQSGSHVAVVLVQPRRGMAHGTILKLLPPLLARQESHGVQLAKQYTSRTYFQRHLVDTTTVTALPCSDWWLHLQETAHADLTKIRPLAMLIDDPEFARHCEVIASTIVKEWNPGDADQKSYTTTIAEFLLSDMASKIPELKAFASAAGNDRSRHDAEIRIPGRLDSLPNPLVLLDATTSTSHQAIIFTGNGHGDLHPGNIFIPVDRHTDASGFRLIDFGRFSNEMPVSRDPTKLMLSIAHLWLPCLKPQSRLRSTLAELIVTPTASIPSPNVAGYLEVARCIYTAAATWGMQRNLGEAWTRQHHLTLVASALRYVGRNDIEIEDRWWFFEVAALAAKELLTNNETRHAVMNAPANTTDQPNQRTFPRSTGDGTSHYPVKTKLDFCRRLGDSWKDLALVLDILPHEFARFPQGDEARHIWHWLEARNRLHELSNALTEIDRADLNPLHRET